MEKQEAREISPVLKESTRQKGEWKKRKRAGLARNCTNPGSSSETWPHGHFIQIGFLLEGKQTFYSLHKRAVCQYGYLAGIPVATISPRTMLPHLSFVSEPPALRFPSMLKVSSECCKGTSVWALCRKTLRVERNLHWGHLSSSTVWPVLFSLIYCISFLKL